VVAHVGIGRWVIQVPGCRSLKDKRSVVRSLRDRLRARQAASVAETDFQDELQRAELTAAFVASDHALAESMLGRLDAAVCSDPRIYIIERDVRIHRPDAL
jgi:hypothetical protein